jgi:uncharacterized membrane protein
MMKKRFVRLLITAWIVLPAVAMLTVAFDADARRLGGGASMGAAGAQGNAATPRDYPPGCPKQCGGGF